MSSNDKRPVLGRKKSSTPKSAGSLSGAESKPRVKPSERPVSEIRMHFAPQHQLKGQVDLGTDQTHITSSVDFTDAISRLSPEAGRILHMARLPQYKVVVPLPKNTGTYTLEYMEQYSREAVLAGATQEAAHLGRIHADFVQSPEGLTKIGREMVGWFESGGFSLFSGAEDPEAVVDLYQAIMTQCIEPEYLAGNVPILGIPPKFLDADKVPKGLLLNGKPPRSSLKVGIIQDLEVQNQYAAIMCAEAFGIECRRFHKLHGNFPDEWSEVLDKLERLAAEAREARKADREAADQLQLAQECRRADVLNTVLKDPRIELLIKHRYSCHEPVEEALFQHYKARFEAESDVPVVVIASNQDSWDHRAENVQTEKSPSLHALRILDAVKTVLESAETKTLLEGRKPKIDIASEVESPGSQSVHIDGLLLPRNDGENRFIEIHTSGAAIAQGGAQ